MNLNLDMDALLNLMDKADPYPQVGLVDQVIGLVIESKGPKAKIADVCLIETGDPFMPTVPAEVVGFKEGKILLMPLGELGNLSPGARVFNTGHSFRVNVGPELLGRVLDGLGNPIDDRFPVSNNLPFHVHAHAPHPLKRKEITEVIPLGVKSIDGFNTIGKGQRVGIFAGSGVGKSTTLGMIARNTEADLSVIALIGERGREVQDFIDHSLGPEGRKRSVVVVSTSEQPALMKIKAALVATTVAEYFRKSGKNVLLMMDSLTRVAMALREVGLAVGEPPTTRGYTPSVFAFMPKLLERSGTSDTGSITGLYTVLVEGDDMNEPVADTVRGLLDGHIVLSRELAQQNHFPAVDVLASVSRLMTAIAEKGHREAAGKIRDLMALYKRSEDLINIGAYVQGANPKLDQAVALKGEIDALLKQEIESNAPFTETVDKMLAIVGKAGI
ncbi:FliI/YscN family ATPase [Vampirovibrio chlorellavorus]|uniref:FliI/YscN family ATPase n=1 Tax=Vampirovibrio chlorellavorus TaxID=758823 RepID=UPI0026EC7C24|nr:FliI/YscN family ATPase [Vampirovibrio chlorellavorus]